MKSKIALLTALTISIFGYSQYEIKVNVKDDVLEILPPEKISEKNLKVDPGLGKVLYMPNADKTKRLSSSEINDKGFSAITYLIDEGQIDGEKGAVLKEIKDENQVAEGKFLLVVSKEEDKFIFLIKIKKNEKFVNQGEKKEVFYCKELDSFRLDKNDCSKGIDTSNDSRVYDDIIKIPYPRFDYDKDKRTNWNKHNRNLYIDANPNPNSNTSVQLRKGEIRQNSYKEDETYHVHIKGNLTLYISSLNINEISELDFKINGANYSYNKDLSEILGKPKGEENKDKDINTKATSGDLEKDSIGLKFDRNERKVYLEKVLKYFKDSVIALSKNDIKKLNQYKSVLNNTVYANNIDLSAAGRIVLSELLSWFPKYIGLTPISPKIGDNDEIDLSISLKYDGGSKETIPVQSYKVNGGVSFDLGGAFFFTGLKNNRVFTEEVGEGDESQLLAKKDDENQLSVGFGLNSEVSFRTGGLFRPTFNIGAFIPFEEEISPYIAIGPGVGLYDKKLKINLLAGLAVGKVNAIKTEFIEKDLSEMDNLTNESISEKIWDSSWFIGIGIRYNVKK